MSKCSTFRSLLCVKDELEKACRAAKRRSREASELSDFRGS
jgi:hypothetical protein